MNLKNVFPGGAVIWLTGLSGAGKTTLAEGAARILREMGADAVVIDGDVLRQGISRHLGFSDADRRENIRRAGDRAIDHARRAQIAIVALISPIDEARKGVRLRCLDEGLPYALIYLDVPIEVCERRDPKGMYQLARAGQIAQFTGITSPYEPPTDPTLVIDTGRESPAESINRVVDIAIKTAAFDASLSDLN